MVLLGGAAQAQSYFPAPPTPAGNPVTTPKALLGMALFWEEQLSSSNTTACGTCHIFSNGGVDPRAASRLHPGADGLFGTPDDVHGAGGVPASSASGHYTATNAFGVGPQVTSRKAPSVINASYLTNLFYDGRASQGNFRDPVTNQIVLTGPCAVENLVSGPPVNSVEMAHAGRSWIDVANKIADARPLALANNVPARLQAFVGNASSYRELFSAVYGNNQVTPVQIIFAIATYLRTLNADQSPYDRYLRGTGTLTTAQDLGRQQFMVAHANAVACIQCHGDLQPTSHQFGPSFMQTTPYGSLPVPNSHNTGVRPIAEDPGVGVITTVATDQGRFKTPGLRNVALHGTWFHNGSQGSLTSVVEFYNRGGDFHVNQATEIQPRGLNNTHVTNLVAFLESLTDPRVANEQLPFDRPRLGSESPTFAPTRFGTGTAGTGGLRPRAVAHEPVFRGSTATLAVENALPNTAALLMWDTDAVQQGFSYAGLQFYLGFYNFVSFYVGQTQAGSTGGYASHPITVPAIPALAGTRLYAQWLLIDPAGPVGATTSDAT
ncbi:MAG: cytochrome c peroxidase, partial [Planctomycetota bacterium]|nr:cytochrome c peroxidase [Planctomycetota bacterium]